VEEKAHVGFQLVPLKNAQFAKDTEKIFDFQCWVPHVETATPLAKYPFNLLLAFLDFKQIYQFIPVAGGRAVRLLVFPVLLQVYLLARRCSGIFQEW
jgi:hypothetical protein